MPTPLKDTNLFKPIKIGEVELANRLIFAPTTRFRATAENVPTDSMLEYYSLRAKNNGGLLVTESTAISAKYGYLPNWTVMETEQQVDGWKQIAEAVHKEKSFISLQLLAGGRVAPPALFKAKGFPFVGPSAIYVDEASKKAALECDYPLKEISKEQMDEVKQHYVSAAKKAIQVAKFDFVELHAAHMCLLNQFLDECTNQRTDEYGGSIENRARYVLEVVDAVAKEVGAGHVGIRISPYSRFMGGQSIDAPTNPAVNYGYLLSELQRTPRVAYVSFVEARNSAGIESEEPRDIDTSWVSEIWKGPLIRTGNLLHDKEHRDLERYVDGDDRTLIGASRYFTSNPDLPRRLKDDLPLTEYDRDRFYNAFSNDGYLTWPTYGGGETNFDDVKKRVPRSLG